MTEESPPDIDPNAAVREALLTALRSNQAVINQAAEAGIISPAVRNDLSMPLENVIQQQEADIAEQVRQGLETPQTEPSPDPLPDLGGGEVYEPAPEPEEPAPEPDPEPVVEPEPPVEEPAPDPEP